MKPKKRIEQLEYKRQLDRESLTEEQAKARDTLIDHAINIQKERQRQITARRKLRRRVASGYSKA